MEIGRRHAGADGGSGRSSAISRKISWNICRGIATSAICNFCLPLPRRSGLILSRAAIGMGSAEFSVRAKAAANMPSAGIVLKEPTSFSAGAVNVEQSLHRARVLTRQSEVAPCASADALAAPR